MTGRQNNRQLISRMGFGVRLALVATTSLVPVATAMPVAAATVQAQETVSVRTGEHPTFSRIVFEFSSPPAYTVVKSGTGVVVSIERPVDIAWGNLLTSPMDRISGPESVVMEDRTVASFSVPASATTKHYQAGNIIVLDIVDAVDAVGASEQSESPAQPVDNPAPSEEDTPAPVTQDNLEPAEVVEQPAEQISRPTSAALTTADGALIVNPRAIDGGVELTFPWDQSVSMAAFVRGPNLWVMFDAPATFDNARLLSSSASAGRLSAATQDARADITVMRYRIRSGQSVKTARSGNQWMLTIQDAIAKPRTAFQADREAIPGGGGGQLVVDVGQVAQVYSLEDPDIGDLFYVVPVRAPGAGVADPLQYAEVLVQESAQGLAVEPVSEDVRVDPFGQGVAITTGAGLAFDTGEIGESLIEVNEMNAGRTFELASWRFGPANRFRFNESRLLYRLSAAGNGDRNPERWDLARYYLAHHRASEARGYLRLMLGDNPSLAENTEYLGVRGIAAARFHHYDEAVADLDARELQRDPDIALWRALSHERLGNHDAALEAWQMGRDVVGSYDDWNKAMFLLSGIRTALETGNLQIAEEDIALAASSELTVGQVDELRYLRGKLRHMQGDNEGARTDWVQLVNSPDRWSRARARFALLDMDMMAGAIEPADAIQELERIRLIWRDNNFELEPLGKLAELYFQEGQYDLSFDRYQIAIDHFADDMRSRTMRVEQQNQFEELFLQGGADELPPIQAIALYTKYRLLTPQGDAGDLMIRKLANRLVSVELLDRAAGLLLHQVTERYKDRPFPQSQVAAQLARIYILDNQPEAAIAILRNTRNQNLPDEILDDRNYVEARALMQQGKLEEAEVVLERYRTDEADRMRAEIYLGLADWPRLAATTDRLLGNVWQGSDPLDDDQRLNLVRSAVAMAMDGDNGGLARLRNRYGNKMRTGRFSSAFEMLTGRADMSMGEISDIVAEMANVDQLQGFMQQYRDDFAATGR